MRTHSPDFEISKFGLRCRLVRESDAEFILSLRTDPNKNKYIHSTDSDIEKQREWIREYKKREDLSLEYYFIYEKDGTPIGVNRIYDIEDDHCTEGSWICLPLEDSSLTIATALIIRDIIFEIFDFDYDVFNVSIGNKKVKKFHLISGANIIREDSEQYYFLLDKGSYFKNRQWFIDAYQLK